MDYIVNILRRNNKIGQLEKYHEKANILANYAGRIPEYDYVVPYKIKKTVLNFLSLLGLTFAKDHRTCLGTFINSANNNLNYAIRFRASTHPAGPLNNWTKYEAMGKPNQRFSLFFDAKSNDGWNETYHNSPDGVLMGEYCFNAYHLENKEDAQLIINSIIEFYRSGTFNPPNFQPKETNENKRYSNMKKLIRYSTTVY